MNNKLVAQIKNIKEIQAPEWAVFFNICVHKERPPVNPDWWEIRAASVLSKINKFGPVGTNSLAKQYGGRKNRGNRPDKKCSGSRNIVRKCIQQLEKAKLIKQVTSPKAGKILTKEGKDLLNKSLE